MAKAAQKATAISLRTGSAFFWPQYWLASTTMPLLMPKTNCWRMNWIWFTAATPERAVSE